MSKRFGRLARVLVKRTGSPDLIFPATGGGAGDVTGVAPEQQSNDLFSRLSDRLHIKFHVEKDIMGQPNRLDLSIFNLAPSTRRQMQQSGGYVVLQAGYQSDKQNLPTLFEGNIRTLDHLSNRPEWETRIQCGDGETCYRYATVVGGTCSGSWSAGTPKANIAKDLAIRIRESDPLRIKIDRFLAMLNDNPPSPDTITFPQAQFFAGYAASGNALEALSKLLGPGYELFLQNGELLALAPTGTITQDAILLDAAHGLISSPVHCAPVPGTLVSLLKATSLLDARFSPGKLVQVRSADDPRGTSYRVQKVVHIGDLSGNEWESNLELLPLTSAGQAPA